MDYSKELEVAKEAARKAAALIQDYQNKRSFGVDFKGQNDLVTEADVDAEQAIKECIKDTFPEDRFIAEETETKKFMPQERTWLIDPIDGTTNFVHGFPIYCVSIGFWQQKAPKAGVVLEVNSGDCFYAIANEGAWLNGNQISVSTTENPQKAMLGTGFPYNNKSFAVNYLHLFEYLLHHTQSVRRSGSAAFDLCCVASGRYEGFYEHSLQPWDVGAAALIVQEAGGCVTDWQGGDDWLLGEYLIAANQSIHSFLLQIIQEQYL